MYVCVYVWVVSHVRGRPWVVSGGGNQRKQRKLAFRRAKEHSKPGDKSGDAKHAHMRSNEENMDLFRASALSLMRARTHKLGEVVATVRIAETYHQNRVNVPREVPLPTEPWWQRALGWAAWIIWKLTQLLSLIVSLMSFVVSLMDYLWNMMNDSSPKNKHVEKEAAKEAAKEVVKETAEPASGTTEEAVVADQRQEKCVPPDALPRGEPPKIEHHHTHYFQLPSVSRAIPLMLVPAASRVIQFAQLVGPRRLALNGIAGP